MPTESLLYKVETNDRSSLYYNQYEWCITINISEASCLRYLETVRFEAAVRNAKYWAENDKWTDRAWSVTKETALRCCWQKPRHSKQWSVSTLCAYTPTVGAWLID